LEELKDRYDEVLSLISDKKEKLSRKSRKGMKKVSGGLLY
jgi:hypothetical protein